MSEVVRPIVLGTATLAALAGCAEPAAPTASVAATVDTRIGQQGRLLLGFRAPDVRTFALPAAVNAPTVTADGALVADGRDAKSFIGTTLSATGDGATLAMRIVDAIAPDATSARWRYALEQWDPATSTALGNYPQAYSHLGLINAAVRLARANMRATASST